VYEIILRQSPATPATETMHKSGIASNVTEGVTALTLDDIADSSDERHCTETNRYQSVKLEKNAEIMKSKHRVTHTRGSVGSRHLQTDRSIIL